MSQPPDAARTRPSPLDERTLGADPIEVFRLWYEAAMALGDARDVMALATATPDGAPAARMVLLRGFDARGFRFFTNYESRKARELEANPRAALVLHWAPLHRQVRIEGGVERAEASESDAYFDRRPVGSRLSAIASPQSRVVDGREPLEARVRELAARHRDGAPITRPAWWGGYRLSPRVIEFWQSGEHRLHDRFRYTREGTGWTRERLAP